MKLITLDIGNSAVKAGVFQEGLLESVTRIEKDRYPTGLAGVVDGRPDAVALVSVVPRWTDATRGWVTERWGLDAVALDAFSELPFGMGYDTPETLGADRLAAAAGAWDLAEDRSQGLVIIDGGTALTIDVISPDGVFMGGVIAPGPELLREALHSGTAQLPRIELSMQTELVGRSTAASIRSGIMNGFGAMVRSLVGDMATAMGSEPEVFLTGGWSEFLSARMERDTRPQPNLVLEGVRALFDLNPPG